MITVADLMEFAARDENNNLSYDMFISKALEYVNQFEGNTHTIMLLAFAQAQHKSQGRSVSGRIGFICGYLDQAYFNIYGEYPK